jgi:hypothetical protein
MVLAQQTIKSRRQCELFEPAPPPTVDAARQGHETPGGGMALRGSPQQKKKSKVRDT